MCMYIYVHAHPLPTDLLIPGMLRTRCVLVCIHVSMHLCICVRMYNLIRTVRRVTVCMCVCMYVCMYVRMYNLCYAVVRFLKKKLKLSQECVTCYARAYVCTCVCVFICVVPHSDLDIIMAFPGDSIRIVHTPSGPSKCLK